MSDRLEGPGWWQASDGHWYPPQTHPDYRAPESHIPRRRHSAPKPPFYRRAGFLVVAAVIVIVVVIAAAAGPAQKDHSPVTIAARATTTSTISGSGKSSTELVPVPGADPVSSATTVAPPSGAAREAGAAVLATASPSVSSQISTPQPAPTTTPAPAAVPAQSHARTAALHRAPIPGCHATMANATPGDGGTDNLTVTSDLPNTAATVTAHYKTTDRVFAIQTDAAGGALLSFLLGRPAPRFTVDVSVVVGGAMCWTSFQPQ